MNYAEHGGDDAQRRHSVGNRLQRPSNRMRVRALGFQFGVHNRFQLMRVTGAERQQTQIVAEELERLVVFGEAGIGLEQRALLRIVDVALERQITFRLRRLEGRVEQR